MKTQITKIITALFISTFLFSCSPYITEDMSEEFGTTIDGINYSNLELEVLKKVNAKRRSEGVKQLTTYNLVSSYAQEHTDLMMNEDVDGDKLKSNQKQERLNNLKEMLGVTVAGEIVTISDKGAEGIIEDWIDNATDANVLFNKSYTKFGIAIEKDAQGVNYITFLFVNSTQVEESQDDIS